MSTTPYATFTPPPAPKPPRRAPWIALAALTLVIGMVWGHALGSTSTSADAAMAAPAAPATVGPSSGYIPPVYVVPTAPPATATPSGVGQGEWLVGTEVPPGTYRSAGAERGVIELCSAATEDANGRMIDWKTGNAGEPVLIKITEKASTFSNSGCEPFVKVG